MKSYMCFALNVIFSFDIPLLYKTCPKKNKRE